jgi:uncharacterized SAM-binding protein YcdF (DUF218 family)
MQNDAVDAALLSPGKTLTDPLLLVLALSIALLLPALRRAKSDRTLRRLLGCVLLLLVLLGVVATEAFARFLTWTLLIEGRDDRAPEVIVVASGGSIPGPVPDLDVLTESSETRIRTAAAWWREHPSARVVITGADQTAEGMSVRTLELMREVAVARGVPAQRVTIEGESRNTREHALRLAQFPGMSRTTRVGLVTSAWHMRRARREVERQFDVVIARSAQGRSRRMILNDVIPSSHALRTTTRMLHEWLGLAWYALRR